MFNLSTHFGLNHKNSVQRFNHFLLVVKLKYEIEILTVFFSKKDKEIEVVHGNPSRSFPSNYELRKKFSLMLTAEDIIQILKILS